ncbi:MAG: phage recombination protein Bet [Chromatiaceae bacterium]|nr:phage recombination protein Bet [Chromatiaceae bacterium]
MTTNNATTALAVITDKLAARFSLGDAVGADLVQTLKQTAFRGPVSDAQMTALLVVASQHGLNPWTREIYAFPDRQNGIVPVVGVDGWARIINEHPMFDGMDFEQDSESCTCIIHRKDRAHPAKVTEWLAECRRNTQPWQSHPRRMLRHKAMIQAARLAFGYGGIFDPDEAERIVEREMGPAEVVTDPALSRTESLKAKLAGRLRPREAIAEAEVLPPVGSALTARLAALGIPVQRSRAAVMRRFPVRYEAVAAIDLDALDEDVAAWVESQLPRWAEAVQAETPPPAPGTVDGSGADWGDGFGGEVAV